MDDDRMSDVKRKKKKSRFVFVLLPSHPEKNFSFVSDRRLLAKDGKSYQNVDDL